MWQVNICPYIYIYTNIYTNTNAKRVLMTRSFQSHTQNKIFHDMVIYLVQERNILQRTLYFSFLLTYSEPY